MRRGPSWLAAIVPVALVGWTVVSYLTGGLAAELVAGVTRGDSLEVLRAAVERAGALAPLAYVAAVVVEVVVAPLPGTLLYAPGGAIFGGLLGGTLSLAGNVIGAMVAASLAQQLGHRVTAWLEQSDLGLRVAGLGARGVLLIALLRGNPLTSSDLVSYAAGLAGIAAWRVGLGTGLGMAPLCYGQAYAAEWLFTWLPASGPLLAASAAAYLLLVVWLLVGRRRVGIDSSTRS